MYTTTLKALRDAGACFEGYNKVVRMLQNKQFTEEDEARESYIRFAHKELISLVDICENNGIEDAIWALRAVPDINRDCGLFVLWCARQVEHLNTDPRVKACNDMSERFANGDATEEELRAARHAAADAASAAYAAYAAADANANAYAAYAASNAASNAACVAAYAAAHADAAYAARAAAHAAAAHAAYAAADAAAAYAERSKQKEMFILMCNGLAPWQEGVKND